MIKVPCPVQIPGKKQLILEAALMKPLDRVAKMSVLTKAGVEKVFKFGNLLALKSLFLLIFKSQSANLPHHYLQHRPEPTLYLQTSYRPSLWLIRYLTP